MSPSRHRLSASQCSERPMWALAVLVLGKFFGRLHLSTLGTVDLPLSAAGRDSTNMPSKVVKLKSTAGEVLRSRLGCQTCRTRKLKCDEVRERVFSKCRNFSYDSGLTCAQGRPICGQCQKSNRQCTYNPDGESHAMSREP